MRGLCRVAAVCIAVGVAGCGDPLNRQAVSGVVTFQGTPLKTGSVTFVPIDPSLRTTGGSVVTDGKYQIPAAQGLSPGKYRVSFSAMDREAIGPAIPGDPMPPGQVLPKSLLPAKYQGESKLEADVTAGDNVFDFKLD